MHFKTRYKLYISANSLERSTILNQASNSQQNIVKFFNEENTW